MKNTLEKFWNPFARNRKTAFTLCTVAFFMLIPIVKAQQVIGSAGNSQKTDNLSVSWTIGEVVTETLQGESIILTQGFHQPTLKVVSVEEHVALTYKLEAFPNPASDYVNLRMENPNLENFYYRLYDQPGRLVLYEKINADITRIDFGTLAPAVYFITVTEGNKPIRTFKILKTR